MDEQNDKTPDTEESIRYAKKYLEDLLSFFGINTDVYATTEDGEVIELEVPSTYLNGFLIGQYGETMRALQYMVSSALKNNGHSIYIVNLYLADFKKNGGRDAWRSTPSSGWTKLKKAASRWICNR